MPVTAYLVPASPIKVPPNLALLDLNTPRHAEPVNGLVAALISESEHVRGPDEWGTVFPDPRLVAAIVDRVIFNAHIIETGTTSYRLRTSKTCLRAKRP